MTCKIDPGTTHYAGCDCHEEGWLKRLDMERAEIQQLRAQLADSLAVKKELADQRAQLQSKLARAEAEYDNFHNHCLKNHINRDGRSPDASARGQIERWHECKGFPGSNTLSGWFRLGDTCQKCHTTMYSEKVSEKPD